MSEETSRINYEIKVIDKEIAKIQNSINYSKQEKINKIIQLESEKTLLEASK